MIFHRYRDLFEDCAPAFWPWLWLQLYLLLAQKADDGRERLIMVTWWGHVCVLAVGDDPKSKLSEAQDPNQIHFSSAYLAMRTAHFPGDTRAVQAFALDTPKPASDCIYLSVPLAFFAPLLDKSFVCPPG